MLFWTLLLALMWVLLFGKLSVWNAVGGLVLAWSVIALLRRRGMVDPGANLVRLGRALRLVPYFFYELLIANFKLAADLLRPRMRIRPGVVAVPLDLDTDAQIMVTANLITLTPGTLSIDVSDDKKTLYVHALYVPDDIEAFRKEIKQGFERRVREALR